MLIEMVMQRVVSVACVLMVVVVSVVMANTQMEKVTSWPLVRVRHHHSTLHISTNAMNRSATTAEVMVPW